MALFRFLQDHPYLLFDYCCDFAVVVVADGGCGGGAAVSFWKWLPVQCSSVFPSYNNIFEYITIPSAFITYSTQLIVVTII